MKKSSQRVFDLINKDNKLEKNPLTADIVRLGNPKVNTNKDIPRNTEILLTALPGQRVKGSDVKWYDRVDIGKIFATPPTVRIVKNGINTSTDVAWALDAAYPDLELDPNDFAPYPINELPTTAILRALPNSLAWLGECTINVRANCMMGLLSTTLSKLSSSATVRNNNRRITILPETLYKLTGGVIEVVSDEEMAKIKNYNIDQIASLINSGTYMYSPFHYVLDVNDNVFDSRAYYLDSPVIKSRSFIAENETTAIEVSTGSYSIEKIANGYKILIKTKSGDTYKTLRDDQVHVQLAFKPSDEIDYAYLNGTLLGKADDERVWEFILGTDYDIDSKNELLLNTFTMYDNQPGNYPISLLGDIEVIYAVSNYAIADLANSSIDKVLVKYQLPSDVVGIIQERFNLHLGDALSSLWSNSRSVVSELDYVRYTENIPAVYPSNVYEIDPATGRNKLFMIDGKLTMKLLHAKGEVQLVEGEVIYEHTVGEIVKVNGEGVIKDQREILRQVDIFMIDGAFRFATSPIDIAYVKNLASTVISYLEDDIAPISKQLLERTELFF